MPVGIPRQILSVFVGKHYVGRVKEAEGSTGGFHWSSRREHSTFYDANRRKAPSQRQAIGRILLDEIEWLRDQNAQRDQAIRNLQFLIRGDQERIAELAAEVEVIRSGAPIDHLIRDRESSDV